MEWTFHETINPTPTPREALNNLAEHARGIADEEYPEAEHVRRLAMMLADLAELLAKYA